MPPFLLGSLPVRVCGKLTQCCRSSSESPSVSTCYWDMCTRQSVARWHQVLHGKLEHRTSQNKIAPCELLHYAAVSNRVTTRSDSFHPRRRDYRFARICQRESRDYLLRKTLKRRTVKIGRTHRSGIKLVGFPLFTFDNDVVSFNTVMFAINLNATCSLTNSPNQNEAETRTWSK